MSKRRLFQFLLIALVVLLPLSTLQVSQTEAESTEDFWVSKAPMPTARSGFGVAVVNGKIYAIGGGSAVNEMYDPTTDTWTAKVPMSTARSSFGIAVVQNKIYVIGGYNIGLNEVYDTETDTWTTKASMLTPRGGICTNVVDGKIYVIGGAFSGANAGADVFYDVNEVYDPATDTWTIKAPAATPVAGYASAVIDNKIYVIGGYNGSANVDLNQIYDPETDTWSNGAPIPKIVSGASAGATTGVSAPKRIFVIGGVHFYYFDFFETADFTQIYDPESDVWSTGSPMPTPRAGLRVAVVDDILYAIGGSSVLGSGTVKYPISGDPYSTNEQYTPEGYTPTPSPELTPTPEPQQTEQFPTIWVASSVIIAVAASAGFLVYFKKRQSSKSRTPALSQTPHVQIMECLFFHHSKLSGEM